MRRNYKIYFLVIGLFLFAQGSVLAQGFALSFDGINDLVTFGTVPTVSQHTIEAWVKPESHSSPGVIAGHTAGPSEACNKGMYIAIDTGNLPLYVVDISGCGDAPGKISGPAVSEGEWVHIAGTYDGDVMSLYVNGQLIDQKSGIPFDASNWMTAGAVTFFNGEQAFFSGEIDDLRIWNFARTSQEIQDTMNCHLRGTEGGLVGYWKMDEGSGQEVGDSSSGGITGLLGHNSNIESSDPVWVASQAPIENCWGTAYGLIFDNSSVLELLRQYRDEILSKTARGSEYNDMLYESSEEALEVLLDNPELLAKAKDLIFANTTAVDDAIHGQEGVIYNTNEIAAFLDAYAQKAPPTLKTLAKMVKWHMLSSQRKDKLFFGFRLE